MGQEKWVEVAMDILGLPPRECKLKRKNWRKSLKGEKGACSTWDSLVFRGQR